ncbi:MAG: class I SAM-dependent methyltransferase [Saprospiraceae bacterium]|nr:class I SAM-dependent methyltransferase [Saprospiraceae bacterium]
MTLIEYNNFKNYSFPVELKGYGQLTRGLIDQSNQYFYPIFNDIIILHQQYATFIGTGEDLRQNMSFDKKRVFDYYNEVNYKIKDALKIYEDSPKWVDFREVSSKYIKNSFSKASDFYPAEGKYLLDIASGPIGLPEYMDLSIGYEYRVCVDISINALIQAKINMDKAGKKGIYICGDITNIPLQRDSMDVVLSQHTLYHLPKNDQFAAVNELYRVAKPGSKIVIIYSWFYHSWLMNLSLNVIQLYRIIRHFAGKLYVKMTHSKPRLYFYPHSPRWFKTSFEFSDDIAFYCWRSTNKYFLNLFVHKWLFGELLLNKLMEIERKYTRFMGTFGEYPAIVITKKQ